MASKNDTVLHEYCADTLEFVALYERLPEDEKPHFGRFMQAMLKHPDPIPVIRQTQDDGIKDFRVLAERLEAGLS